MRVRRGARTRVGLLPDVLYARAAQRALLDARTKAHGCGGFSFVNRDRARLMDRACQEEGYVPLYRSNAVRSLESDQPRDGRFRPPPGAVIFVEPVIVRLDAIDGLTEAASVIENLDLEVVIATNGLAARQLANYLDGMRVQADVKGGHLRNVHSGEDGRERSLRC